MTSTGRWVFAVRLTSAVSAPLVVASMLDLAHLEPGMRVLEIGTGSGYNAALLRELVGPHGQVTSVDIDDSLIEEAIGHLERAGYCDVVLKTADGYFGVADRAPFDRVIATVGCVDLAPAWLEQLAPGGFVLVPLQHGAWCPLMKVTPVADYARGAVVRTAAFVAIQGRQAGRDLWPNSGLLAPQGPLDWSPLPRWLIPHLKADEGRRPASVGGPWGLFYLIALEDRQACFILSLRDESSAAVIDPAGERIGRVGPGGEQLSARLLDIAGRWVALGRPAMNDYDSTFTALATQPGDDEPWVIERVDYRQTIRLSRTQPLGEVC
jgi:protein-L-isoaspartate(D-aspartate) O-methyltransferase